MKISFEDEALICPVISIYRMDNGVGAEIEFQDFWLRVQFRSYTEEY